VVPPPEKVPGIIPVFFPVITILVAFKVEVIIGESKVNVISESRAIVFDAVAGVDDTKFKGVAVSYQAADKTLGKLISISNKNKRVFMFFLNK
tara:strand:+ start:163 stop:441 length:279 start_codon:yes stop_codon:yes gene_type:complete